MYEIYNDSLIYSGNDTTLTRLSNLLYLRITNKIKNNLIGIHAYKFGKKVINKNLNFIVIIGGTDINVDVYNASKLNVIRKCLKEAKYIIAFNKFIYNKLSLFNINISKIKIISQSIPKLTLSNFINLRQRYDIKTKKIYLLVGNIRPIKDVLYLKEIFKNNDMALIIVGKNFNDFNFNFNLLKNIYHINGLPKNYIFNCMKQVDGLINSSKSEGMSISILEAMKMKCPVYVRNNNGNKSIVKNYYNGFVFSNQIQFYYQTFHDTKQIVKNAFKYVNNIHNPAIEKLKFQKLLY